MWNPKSVVCPFFAERFFQVLYQLLGCPRWWNARNLKPLLGCSNCRGCPPIVMRLRHTPSSLMATVICRIYSHRTPANTNERSSPVMTTCCFRLLWFCSSIFYTKFGIHISFLLSLRHQPAKLLFGIPSLLSQHGIPEISHWDFMDVNQIHHSDRDG